MKSQQALPLRNFFSHFFKEWAFVVKVHQSIIDENSCSDISKAVRTGLNLIFISFGCQMSTPAALITNFRSTHDKTLVWNGNIYLTNNRPFMRWGSLHCFCRVDKQWFQFQRCRRSPLMRQICFQRLSAPLDIYIKGKRPTQRDGKPPPAAQDAKLQTSSPKSTCRTSLITADYSMPLSTHRHIAIVTLMRRDVNVCKSTLLTDSLKMRNRWD